MFNLLRPALVTTAAVITGCSALAPSNRPPQPPVPRQWPLSAQPSQTTGVTADMGWREFFVDDRLDQLIALALENNRDLRIAALNVQRSRSLYRIQRADRLPSVDVQGSLNRQSLPPAVSGAPDDVIEEQYSVSLGATAFELDLFGRVRNLSAAALERYFAEEETRTSLQLSLIAQVATGYLTLAADRSALRLARETLAAEEKSLQLTQRRRDLGAASTMVLNQAQTTVERARADAAFYEGAVAQDINALTLIAGAQIDAALLPDELTPDTSGLDPLPAGLPSEVLLRRPDVQQAERLLRAANADVGAARAAFFPSIRLTGAIGNTSSELSDLFDDGTRFWRFTPQISVPIFQGGRLRANLGVAKADREIAIARYEQSIRAGFREVADALVLSGTLERQRQAEEALAAAAANVYRLSQERYRAGVDSFFATLDAQRTSYAAQQGLISTRLAQQVNRINLYKSLGGGWTENSR